VHVLHSGLSDGERARAWTAMHRGEGRVLVGTRSAVFTPLPDAGLIIVDEEHDNSYKQQDGIRYHARDLAVVRARALAVPVLLGSATPSLESLHNALAGRYTHLRLSQRAGVAKPPRVRVLDVRKRPLTHGLSADVFVAIAACLQRGEQVLVFKNRRGYAPVLLLPRLRLERAVPALRRRDDRARGRPPSALPSLRFAPGAAVELSRLRQPGAATAGLRHRAPGRGAGRAISRPRHWSGSTARARAPRTAWKKNWPNWATPPAFWSARRC
jgi:hypothetical protein